MQFWNLSIILHLIIGVIFSYFLSGFMIQRVEDEEKNQEIIFELVFDGNTKQIDTEKSIAGLKQLPQAHLQSGLQHYFSGQPVPEKTTFSEITLRPQPEINSNSEKSEKTLKAPEEIEPQPFLLKTTNAPEIPKPRPKPAVEINQRTPSLKIYGGNVIGASKPSQKQNREYSSTLPSGKKSDASCSEQSEKAYAQEAAAAQGKRSMTISSLLGAHSAYIQAQQRHTITIDGLFAQQMRKMRPDKINVSSLLAQQVALRDQSPCN